MRQRLYNMTSAFDRFVNNFDTFSVITRRVIYVILDTKQLILSAFSNFQLHNVPERRRWELTVTQK